MNYREKIVYKGAMAIAVALSGLPATQHDRGSFQLEFVTMQPQLLICTLRGLVRDGNDHNKPDGAVKFFMRTFAIVPRDGGFVRLAKFSAISGALCRKMSIINDTLLLSPVGLEREERFRSHVKRSAEAVSRRYERSNDAAFACLAGGRAAVNRGQHARAQRPLVHQLARAEWISARAAAQAARATATSRRHRPSAASTNSRLHSSTADPNGRRHLASAASTSSSRRHIVAIRSKRSQHPAGDDSSLQRAERHEARLVSALPRGAQLGL